MIKTINVLITIQDIEKNKYYSFPMLPATLQYSNGDTLTQSISVVDLGTIEIPNGRDVDSFGFTSEFPARYDAGYVVVPSNKLLKPLDYKKLFEGIKDREAAVQLVIPVLGINKQMYIASFNPEFKGFEGDIGFTINFREIRNVKPKKLTPGGTAPPKGSKSAEDRPKVAGAAKPTTYKVKAGDTLTGIAKQLKIKDWRTQLYEPNKKVIGTDPDNIKAGQVLKV